NVEPRALGFAPGNGDHFGRRVDAADLAIGSDAPASALSELTCATPDLQNGLAWFQVRELGSALSHRRGAAERKEHDAQVVPARPTDQSALRGSISLSSVTVKRVHR